MLTFVYWLVSKFDSLKNPCFSYLKIYIMYDVAQAAIPATKTSTQDNVLRHRKYTSDK